MIYKSVFTVLATSALLLLGAINPAWADWQLDPERSHLSFGSVKKNTIGEVHHFQALSGHVADDGSLQLVIPLESIETWVDIRNERMLQYLFNATQFPEATLTGNIDLSKVQDMSPAEQRPIDARLTLQLAGIEKVIEAELIVIRLSKTDVLVLPYEMIMLDAEDYNLLPGLQKLAELAGLSSISTAVPVSFYLTFSAQ